MDQTLFNRNADAFRTHAPDLWALLQDLAPVSTVVWEGDRPVNIDLSGVPLYPEPVDDWNRRQMEDLDDDPGELQFRSILHCNPSVAVFPLLRQLDDRVAENKISLTTKKVKEIDYAILLGVGLGLHINTIAASDEIRHFIIYEPTLEFLKHSLFFTDWSRLLERKAAGDCEITFLYGQSPEQVTERIRRLIMAYGVTFLEGTAIYPHYLSADIKLAYNLIRQMIAGLSISTGFFEDEVNMLFNSTRNLLRYSSRLIEKSAYMQLHTPAFVVAAGPSLDGDIETLKRLADQAIIISCGTSLGILLKAGIVPDLHVENENSPVTAKVLDGLADQHDLSSIRLTATTTVTPAAGRHFGDRWFFYRAGLSSTVLFSNTAEAMYGCFPLVANAAFSVASRLGFQSIYLFGCDCGSKDATRHHASGSVYHGDTIYDPAQSDDRWKKGQDRALPGNFGGTVLSTRLYDQSRQHFNISALWHTGRRFNCSDGARIEMFVPMDSYDIEPEPDWLPKATTLSLLDAQLTRHDQNGFRAKLKGLSSDAVLGSTTTLKEQLRRAVDGVDFGPGAYRRLFDAVRTVTCRTPDLNEVAQPMLAASIESMVRICAFYGTRITDDAPAEAFFSDAKTALLDTADAIADRCTGYLKTWLEMIDTPEMDVPYCE